MSASMVDAAASHRLSCQFETVLRRSSPRDTALEARRFVGYLCDRLERNNHALTAGARNPRPDQLFTAASASRQGTTVDLTFRFLLHDLAARVGRARIADYLAATQTCAGRALARRIGSRSNAGLRIAGLRLCSGGGVGRAIDAQPAPAEGTTAVVASLELRGAYPQALRPALVVENGGTHAGHFVAAQVRLFARYGRTDPWLATGGDAFAFLERVSPMEAQVLALRGFDCMELLRHADAGRRDPVALRLIASLA